jgi:hypothetical protein
MGRWENGNDFGFHKIVGNCRVAEQLAASEEGFSSVELVKCKDKTELAMGKFCRSCVNM